MVALGSCCKNVRTTQVQNVYGQIWQKSSLAFDCGGGKNESNIPYGCLIEITSPFTTPCLGRSKEVCSSQFWERNNKLYF
jgi:hypothetical protein